MHSKTTYKRVIWADRFNQVMRRRSKKLMKQDVEKGIEALIKLAPLFGYSISSKPRKNYKLKPNKG